MTQEDILEMARSAGLTDGIELQHEIDAVMRFAELVAAAEREACAKVCDTLSNADKNSHYYWDGASWRADLIRKKGWDENIY